MKKILFLCVFCASCTTAGPFVTNISNGGSNTINVEKCSVEFNGFTGAITNTGCNISRVQL